MRRFLKLYLQPVCQPSCEQTWRPQRYGQKSLEKYYVARTVDGILGLELSSRLEGTHLDIAAEKKIIASDQHRDRNKTSSRQHLPIMINNTSF